MPPADSVGVARVLLEAARLGDELTLSNRVVMAPMTRCMATDGLVPTQEMAAYYARRANCGLIITEATIIRPDGQGYPNTPGIYTDEQISGWRMVTDLVHAAGGRIFCQLWHVGRVSHPHYLDGQPPVAPSAVALTGRVKRNPELEYGTPRALELREIGQVIRDYGQAAANAKAAGFDGVEIHGANGYLIDQFLHFHTNRRDDKYGGSVERNVRFAVEVVSAVVEGFASAHRVGIRLSPGAYHYMDPSPDDPGVFVHLLRELSARSLAYVHTGIFDDATHFDYLGGTATAFLRRHYGGHLVACGSYTPATAARGIANGDFDLIAIGRPFIANPDLIDRIRSGDELRPFDDEQLKTLE